MKKLFKRDRITALFKLAIPLFLETLLAQFLGSIDTIMISKYNEPSVAAIGNANTVIGFLTVLFAICSIGVGIIVSQYLGANEIEKSNMVLGHGIIFNLFIAIIIALIFIIWNKPLLKMTNTPSDIIDEASGYIRIVSIGLPFLAMTSCMSSNFKSHSKPLVVTIVSFSANILNVILNYILIYGFLGIPSLGYKGAAIATVICHIFTCLTTILLTKIILKQKIFIFKLDKNITKAIIKIGGPSALENICYNISQIIVLSQVNLLLTEMLTARTYLSMILAFIYIISGAFGSANSIIVGYNVGKKDFTEAANSTKLSFLLCYPIILILVITINCFGGLIFPLITQNNNILNAIYSVLPILFLYETGRCANLIYINALKSSGDTIFPVVCAIFSMFLVASFGSYLFVSVLGIGFIGIFLAPALDEVVRAILCVIRFYTGKWKNKAID